MRCTIANTDAEIKFIRSTVISALERRTTTVQTVGIN